MKKEIIIKEHIIHIICGNEFATFDRNPNEDGLQGVTFSFSISPKAADIIEKSGIAEVCNYKKSGTLVFKKRWIYETHLMIEIISDIIEKYELEQNS